MLFTVSFLRRISSEKVIMERSASKTILCPSVNKKESIKIVPNSAFCLEDEGGGGGGLIKTTLSKISKTL